MNTENHTIAEIVASHPRAAALLEKYQVDFCCKGKMKLSAQVADVELLSEINEELQELFEAEQVAAPTAFHNMSVSELADYIVGTYHRDAKENMPAISQHLFKVAYKHGDRHPNMVKVASLFEELAREMEEHMMKEELVVFPAIKSLDHSENEINFDKIELMLQTLSSEHERAGNIMTEIRALTGSFMPPGDACMTHMVSLMELKAFEEDLHMHVFLENHFLFTKAAELNSKLMKQ